MKLREALIKAYENDGEWIEVYFFAPRLVSLGHFFKNERKVILNERKVSWIFFLFGVEYRKGQSEVEL